MNKRIKFRLILAFLFLTLFFVASSSIADQIKTVNSDERVIAKGDKLTIKVLEQDSLNGAYVVYDDGKIEFPYIEKPVKATGLTYDELAANIKMELEREHFYKATVLVSPYRSSDMNISVLSGKGGVVYVYGMASRTGVVEIPKGQPLTASQVIIRSGGFKDFANKRAVKLIRKSSVTGKSETKVLNMVNIIDKGQTDKDVIVQDGDMIVVPEQFFNF